MESQQNKYYKGVKIAQQITDAMKSAETLQELEQYEELEEWLLCDPSSKETTERLSSEESLKALCFNYDRTEREDASICLFRDLNKKRTIRKRNQIIAISVSVAAAIFTISMLLYAPVEQNHFPSTIISSNERPSTPTLILNNGSRVNLSKIGNEVKDGGYTISKKNGNELRYSSNSQKSKAESEEQFNELIIPKMYTYNVVLADGTIVYLNANSELKYPTQFSGENREVYLKGEGYFKVTKGSKPFIVNSSDVRIIVHGTEFNVDAGNPEIVKTVLVKGSISVHGEMLSPNQMMTVRVADKHSIIEEVEAARYVAWIDGNFRFEGNRMEDVLRVFGRWYGVDFSYDPEQVKEIAITGIFQNDSNLDEILGVICETVGLEFRKEGGLYTLK